MPWNSEDPSKPGLKQVGEGLGQFAAAAVTGGASAAGAGAAAAGGAAAGEAAAVGNSLGRFGSFLAGKAENSGLINKMSSSASTEGSFLNKMNQSYGTNQVGNWAPNEGGEGSHIVTPQESSGNTVGIGQEQVRQTGTGYS